MANMPQQQSSDEEKGTPVLAPPAPVTAGDETTSGDGFGARLSSAFKRFEKTVAYYNLEARGIQRVGLSERHSIKNLGYSQIGLFWFSVNLAANNVTLGMLGPAAFSLSFIDSSLCAVFGMLVGCLPVAYFATFGPRSGNRSMVLARYSMGWYPSKLVVILNLIVLLGYALIDAVIAGQILSAVSPGGSMSTIVGIVITSAITWVVTTFGYSIFHYYERFSWLPQLIVLSILAGVAGPRFDMMTASQGNPMTIIGHRVSFFSLCLAAAITYSGGAADYFVYYPEETPKWKVFGMTMAGLVASFTFAFMVGIGLGSGVTAIPEWGEAYGVSQGALIVQGYAPLGGFGSFCSVVVALGLIANMIVPTYSSSVDFQVLGTWFTQVPRIVWNTVGVIIYTVCAIAGRGSLAAIFTNFLALMGYWVAIWVAIFLEEHFLFRRGSAGLGWNWEAWNDKNSMPVGLAALTAFLIGWAGSILCMAQVWYVGPLAGLVGDYGADLGNYVGFAWGGLVYAPLRYMELRKMKR
ncbi:Purine-cytosine permease fcyB [Sphaceloma murrayae]|uniref:Purine-cytosine permease fcyB n=1 Tax=Sphaceloma murrayae TaxID=2082308 RepID=A0A2K1QFN5_9PEZI|nr:Purine-cytosine permease fcyB [Sphaceloma murrayae]